MRVLFVTRRGLPWGGEQTQIQGTAAALRSRGLDVAITPELPDDYRSYDLIHFFGLDEDHIDKIRQADGCVKVLSPVFWDKYQQFGIEWDRLPGSGIAKRLARRRRKIARLRDSARQRAQQEGRRQGLARYLGASHPPLGDRIDYTWAAFQEVIDLIDFFLPNSEMEIESVRRCFVFGPDPRWAVAHNAIDAATIDEQSDFAARLGLGRFILCSAGVDSRKNQYNLVRAMAEMGVPLVAAGPVREEVYAQATVELARSLSVDLRLLGALAKPDLNSLYARAAAHVLPSYHETPGISNLEAIAHGCPNVSTKLGGLEEYVGKHSLYCNPYSVVHIRQQVLGALEMPRNESGAAYVRERYTWESAARETLAGYEQALASRR
jgi:glycosyltransferase involved in cell wall biosynthesis